MYQYSARLAEVVDGDTIDVSLDLGFDLHAHMRLRLAHINAAEMHKDRAEAAKAFLVERMPVGSLLTVRTIKDRRVKFGRYLAEVMLECPEDEPPVYINDLMIQEGHALAYETQAPVQAPIETPLATA